MNQANLGVLQFGANQHELLGSHPTETVGSTIMSLIQIYIHLKGKEHRKWMGPLNNPCNGNLEIAMSIAHYKLFHIWIIHKWCQIMQKANKQIVHGHVMPFRKYVKALTLWLIWFQLIYLFIKIILIKMQVHYIKRNICVFSQTIIIRLMVASL